MQTQSRFSEVLSFFFCLSLSPQGDAVAAELASLAENVKEKKNIQFETELETHCAL